MFKRLGPEPLVWCILLVNIWLNDLSLLMFVLIVSQLVQMWVLSWQRTRSYEKLESRIQHRANRCGWRRPRSRG